MSASTVPAAKAALLDIIRAVPELANVQVEWGHPGKNIEDECIFLDDVKADEQSTAALGNRRRDEQYDLPVVVTVEQYGAATQDVETRCWALEALVENALRANATLNDTVNEATVTATPVRNFPGPEQRISECVLTVHVRTRI